jgi:tetratricopeptide (TPR) repeat protein
VWNVPPHNPHFTGRGAELADLARGLTGGSAVTVHSVHGLGGVGKTQLAAEYAHARAADYEVAWWVAAEEASLIPDQFAGLARRLGLDPATEPDLVRAQVHDRLREVAGWLLVFDNADDADGIRSWLPAAPQPFGVPGHVLVTRPLLERALAITGAAYGPDHPVVATCLNNLAAALRDLGDPGQARPLIERALTITETAYGPDHSRVATYLNNLALTLQDLGEPGQARPLLERAAAIDGKRHPDGPEPDQEAEA